MQGSKVTIGYWGIKGRGEAIRHIAAYTGVDFQNKAYTDPNEWFGKDKPALKTAFPNLPYVLDGDFAVTESDACAFYLIHKSKRLDLMGANAEEVGHLTQLKSVVIDAIISLFNVAMNLSLSQADLASGIQNNVVPKVTALAKDLGIKEWFLGRITVVDFFFVQLLKYLSPNSTCVKDLKLCDYIKRYDELPAIKAYIESDKNIKGPNFNPLLVNPHFKVQ